MPAESFSNMQLKLQSTDHNGALDTVHSDYT